MSNLKTATARARCDDRQYVAGGGAGRLCFSERRGRGGHTNDDELNRPYGRIRQGKRANVLRAGGIAPGDIVNIRVLQATAGQLTGLLIPTNSEPAA